MNTVAFVIYDINNNLYLHSTKDGGTDDITCAYMTSLWPVAIGACQKANSKYTDCNWIIRSISIRVIEEYLACTDSLTD